MLYVFFFIHSIFLKIIIIKIFVTDRIYDTNEWLFIVGRYCTGVFAMTIIIRRRRRRRQSCSVVFVCLLLFGSFLYSSVDSPSFIAMNFFNTSLLLKLWIFFLSLPPSQYIHLPFMVTIHRNTTQQTHTCRDWGKEDICSQVCCRPL